jgi:hypothetical protein
MQAATPKETTLGHSHNSTVMILILLPGVHRCVQHTYTLVQSMAENAGAAMHLVQAQYLLATPIVA